VVVAGRDFKRLANAVLDRRAYLGLTQEAFAARANLAVKTVQRVEDGQESRPKTLGALDRAAGWVSGSARKVVAGGEPEVEGEEQSPQPAGWDALEAIEEMQTQLDQMRRHLERQRDASNFRRDRSG
jgi:transcriptional regulator with XRE-family HTH domain